MEPSTDTEIWADKEGLGHEEITMAEAMLSELREWYTNHALTQVYHYHKPAEPIGKWPQSAPKLIKPHRDLKQVLGVVAAFSFNRKALTKIPPTLQT